MRFADTAARLDPFPDRLPAPLAALMPQIMGGPVPPRWQETPDDRTVREACVLVLLYPDQKGETRVVLIERTTHDGHHSGEVSFPGGKVEPDDRDASDTALREAREEVDLDPGETRVRVVGALERFWIPVSDFGVTPIVALAERRPTLRASDREVARIVEPPVARFLPGASIELVERTIRGTAVRYGAYAFEGLSIWGATARVLSQLGQVLVPPVPHP